MNDQCQTPPVNILEIAKQNLQQAQQYLLHLSYTNHQSANTFAYQYAKFNLENAEDDMAILKNTIRNMNNAQMAENIVPEFLTIRAP